MRSSWITLAAAGLLSVVGTPALWAAENELSPEEKSDGWLLLFDGHSLEGWMTSSRLASRRS